MRRPRRRHGPGGRGPGVAPPDDWMEDVLSSEVRKADSGTWDTSVGLP